MAPVPAAGRTLRELRADLEARSLRELGGSEVFVSIGQVRQIARWQELGEDHPIMARLGGPGGCRAGEVR